MIGLEFICQNRDIKFTDLANELGIGKQNITNWIVGRSKIPHKHLEKLSEILGIAGEWLQKELTENEKVELLFVLQDNNSNKDIENFKKLIINNINSYFSKWKTEDIQVNIVLLQMLLDVIDKELITIETIHNVLTALSLANDKTETSSSKFVNIIKQLIEEEDIKSVNSIIMESLLEDNSLLQESEINLLRQNNLLHLTIQEQIKKLRQLDMECNKLANKLSLLQKFISS